MQKIRQETIVRDVVDYFCDFCDAALTYEVSCEWCCKNVCGRCSIEIDFNTVDCVRDVEHVCIDCLSFNKEKIKDIQERTVALTEEYLKYYSETQSKIQKYRDEIGSLSSEFYNLSWSSYKKMSDIQDDIKPTINGYGWKGT